MSYITTAMICTVCSFASGHLANPGPKSGFDHLSVPAINRASVLDVPSFPGCNVSLIGYRSSYSPSSCSELLAYPPFTGCSYGYISFQLEDLPSCVEYKNWQFLSSVTFTPFFTALSNDYPTVLCDVGQGINYTGTLTAINHSHGSSVQLNSWNIEIDTSNLEHCAAIRPPPEIDTNCLVNLESPYKFYGGWSYNEAFRPTSCDRSVLATVSFSAGCRYFQFTTSYEFGGFEECTAVQFVNGTLIFDISNAFCDIRSARTHTGFLNVYNSLKGNPDFSKIWSSWNIQILTGGLQGCVNNWSGQVSTTPTKAFNDTGSKSD